MNVRIVGLALAGLGAAVLIFGVIMWATNRPDFSAGVRSGCRMLGQPGSSRYDECFREASRNVDQANAAYNACLFSSQYAACQNVMAVPYLSIAGIMILLAGGGLFLVGLMRRPSSA